MKLAFNPIGPPFDYVGSTGADNFSYYNVGAGVTVSIPSNQQMLVDGHVRVEGHMTVLGQLVDISGRKKEQFFYTKIDADDVVVVEQKRLLIYKDHLVNLGHLRVIGQLSGV